MTKGNDMTVNLDRVHAHIFRASRDCDGSYNSGYTAVMSSTELADTFGEIHFRERVVASEMSTYSCLRGTLEVHGDDRGNVERVDWNETTEEGYRHAEIEFCKRKRCCKG